QGTVTTGPGDTYETKDGGIRWQATGLHLSFPEPALTPELHGTFRCRGYSNHGRLVGTPGSVILQIDKSQKPVVGCVTGQSIPLNAGHFQDANTGWAVGELGTILATVDGGKTWQAQKRGGQRAAIMCINAQAKNTPLDLVSALGAADGYLVQ